MDTRTLTVSEEAYALLSKARRKGEDIDAVVRRTFAPRVRKPQLRLKRITNPKLIAAADRMIEEEHKAGTIREIKDFRELLR